MDQKNWQTVKEHFLAALELDITERSGFLNVVCVNDPEMLAEVESLLAAHNDIGDFIENAAFRAEGVFSNGTDHTDRHFGHYKIIREIGSGGMGAVYLAERDDGEFSQRVAVKIIRQAIAETELVNRFKRERQILATLNHQNIAKLLDGGVSDDGLPFLAMEFVEGSAITKYAAEKGLSLNDRLRLFIKVCGALSYAHRNLIVHRDLKPSNILVTDEGEPKLLDFGLAKLLDADIAGDTEQTQTAFRALTPAYASPEQLSNGVITTASDVYSLGVVLYELLTGSRPFKFDGKSLDDIIRTVSNVEPRLPSANSRSTGSKTNLKGDLDNIALMALRKEPESRYRSVEAFSDDIQRYLDGLPVSARRPTVRYRFSKFITRHKASVAAVCLILLALFGGITVSFWQAKETRRQKEKAEAINSFLEQTLKYANPILSNLRKNGEETTVNEVLDEAARRLDSGEFDSNPEVKAELERTVGSTYFSQGKYNQGRKHFGSYFSLLRQLYGESHPKMVEGSVIWAGLLFAKGQLGEAETVFRQNLPRLREEYMNGEASAETLADALNNFAYLRRTQGDSREAESLFRATLGLIPLLTGESFNSVATTRSTLASTIADQGRFDEALQTAADAVDEFQTRGETDSPNAGFALTVYGGFLSDKGDYAAADANLKAAESIFRKFLTPRTLWLGDNIRNQALSSYRQARYAAGDQSSRGSNDHLRGRIWQTL